MPTLDTPNQFGAYIRRRRLALGWSQTECAALAEVDRPWLSRLERGRANPTLTRVLSLLRVLGVSLQVPPAEAPEGEASQGDTTAAADLETHPWLANWPDQPPREPVPLSAVFDALRGRDGEPRDG